MGCDIHLVVQAKRKSVWEIVDPPTDLDWHDKWDRESKRWFSDRNYDAFGILANVRNGRGFAGTETGDAFIPVAGTRQRGIPEGFPNDRVDDLGEHSFHWLTLRELVDYPHWDRRRVSLGVVRSAEVEKLRTGLNAPPEEYSGGILGPGIRTLSEADWLRMGKPIDDRTYVQVSWGETYAYSAGRLYTHLIPALRRWADDRQIAYDRVRLVFGFDS